MKKSKATAFHRNLETWEVRPSGWDFRDMFASRLGWFFIAHCKSDIGWFGSMVGGTAMCAKPLPCESFI